jgi:Putative peptidoglycan-binding domain-containing protein
MYNDDVKELYDYIPYGTTVTIVHESRPFRMMISGDVGSDVREIQINLKKLGYYNGSPDGVFGDYLKKAVEDFQTDNKIYCTGKADRNTVEILKQKVLEYESAGQIS